MFDRILDLPPTQRLVIYVGSAVLIICTYAFLFHIPLSKEIGDKQGKVQRLKTEHAKLQTLLRNQGGITAAVNELEEQFNKIEAQLPGQKEISQELLRQVSELGYEVGLEVLSFRLKPEHGQDLYTEVPMEMAVRGGYHQIGLFFDKVRQLDQIVNIADINLRKPQFIAGQLQVESEFSATTYRLVSEEEREKFTKEKVETEKKGKKRSSVP